ncbi:MAG: crossover junction endodeoxyribonuclease RuvC [Gemmataceae bacterium]
MNIPEPDWNPTRPQRLLGIDPGLRITGYAVLEPGIDRPLIAEAGIIRTTEKRDSADMARRLKLLYEGLREVVEQWQPTGIAVEQLYAHYAHPRTAILMGHARGVFFLLGAQYNIPMYSISATRVKKTITGSGRASKEQMQYAIMRELGLAEPPQPADVADAVAVVLCQYYLHHHRTGWPR